MEPTKELNPEQEEQSIDLREKAQDNEVRKFSSCKEEIVCWGGM